MKTKSTEKRGFNMKNIKLIILSCFILVIAGFAYFYIPTQAAQPGTNADPLVTQRFVEEQISKLSEEIAILRGILATVAPNALPSTGTSSSGTNISASDRDGLFAEVMEYFEKMYGERLDRALEMVPPPGHEPREPQTVVFTVLNPQAGQVMTFNAGTEFILRGGRASAVTGPLNGIPDVTAGQDVMNGENIGLNHLMMIPVTDGRGVHFQAESWIMVRGGYTLVN
jgi:hypothetical protein